MPAAPARRTASGENTLTNPEPSKPGQVLRLAVPAALDGERVDRGLALLAGVSRAHAARLVAQGRARIGGSVVGAGSRRMHGGDLLEVELAPEQLAQPDQPILGSPAPGHPGPWPEACAVPEATVVFADPDVVVVDKPAGLVVHPGAGNSQGTLVQQLLARFPDIAGAGPDGDRPGIVHRLDKGTSGLLVVARNFAARESLVSQMAARSAERRYLAVVHGELGSDEGAIDAPLGRSQSERVKMAVVHGGRHAVTHYWARSRSRSPLPVTLLSCRLETGRTHQVRVHFAAIGHPVVADERYCKPSQLAAVRRVLPALRRPWLHAALLGFSHPVSGERMSFTSPLPADLLGSLGTLGLEVGPADLG